MSLLAWMYMYYVYLYGNRSWKRGNDRLIGSRMLKNEGSTMINYNRIGYCYFHALTIRMVNISIGVYRHAVCATLRYVSDFSMLKNEAKNRPKKKKAIIVLISKALSILLVFVYILFFSFHWTVYSPLLCL